LFLESFFSASHLREAYFFSTLSRSFHTELSLGCSEIYDCPYIVAVQQQAESTPPSDIEMEEELWQGQSVQGIIIQTRIRQRLTEIVWNSLLREKIG